MKPTIDATKLRDIFQKKYDRKEWVNVLREVFMVSDIYATPKFTGIHNDEWGAKVYELGNFETKEGRLVGIYEVPINSKVKLERNKIGLRNLLKSVYKEDVDAAFIIFDQGAKWRFSYVSEISVKDPATKKRVHKKTDPKRYTYIMGEGERCKTAADRFSRIHQSEDLFDVGIELKTIEEAFSVEKLSKSFFEGYKKLYGQFVAYLTGNDESGKQVYHPKHGFLKSTFHGDEKAARDFVKKMMGRIVFLYFLEKKGWLGVPENGNWGDGLQNFLSDLFKDCAYKEDFYAQVLVPLFFDTLNTERANDLFKIKSGIFARGNYSKLKIPFLNGGLFDSEAEETQLLVFKKEHFEELFHFFDQYNFTVYEDSPEEHTVAVDPEMLGHIFENLLEDNKDKGAFYTPKEIVHYMCQESLIEYLHTKLNPDTGKEAVSHAAIEKFIKHREAGDIIEHDEALLNALREVKICDPAIGSGAFPMGLLHEIFYAVELLSDVNPDTTAKVWKLKKWDPAKVKLAIIENSIYGVDIEQGAVDIARLRFWLSLVVDEEKPQPLPNLDYKIVVGDSLLPKLKIDGEEEVIEIDWKYSEGNKAANLQVQDELRSKQQLLKDRQHQYFNVKYHKAALHKDIEGLKADILIKQLAISKLSYVQNTSDKGGFAPTAKEILHNHERNMVMLRYDALMGKLQEIKKKKEDVCFFDWKFNFPEVMMPGVNKGEPGFDIVIGNPPYIQLQKLSTYADALQKRKFATFARTGDIYCLFYEEGFQVLKPKGILTFITSNKWMRAAYGELLRSFFVDKNNPLKLIDFGGYQVFENATVDTNILIGKKEQNLHMTQTCVLSKALGSLDNLSDFVNQNSIVNRKLSAESGWVVLSSMEARIKEKIEKNGIPLKDWDINIYRGILTGFNEAFIINEETKEALIKKSPKSAEIIRPILRGRDIQKFRADWQGLYIIGTFPSLHLNIDNYPEIKKHLLSFNYDRLKQTGEAGARKKTNNLWFETQDSISYWEDFSKQKIIWKRIGSVLRFSYDDTGVYCLDSTCFATGKDMKFLVGYLNSTISKHELLRNAPKTGTGDVITSVQALEPLKVPNGSEIQKKNITALVDKCLIQRLKNSNADTSPLELEIDQIVFDMYNFSKEEIAFIMANKPTH